MGAFLVGFPKMRIRMMWLFDLGLFPYFRFWMRAYWLLPLWAFIEINSGMGQGTELDIGHTLGASYLVCLQPSCCATPVLDTR